MKPTVALSLDRLPQKGTMQPMKWLTMHESEIQGFLNRGQLDQLSESTGLGKPTILRWQRLTEKKRLPIMSRSNRGDDLPPNPSYGELMYWRGQADAYRQALEMAVRR